MGQNEEPAIVEAFMLVAELGLALDAAPLNKHDGCWECTVDERWQFAINGHNEPKVSTLSDIPIEPFYCYVMYNGFPAGLINPRGGTIAAGAVANEDTFIAALKARIAKAERGLTA